MEHRTGRPVELIIPAGGEIERRAAESCSAISKIERPEEIVCNRTDAGPGSALRERRSKWGRVDGATRVEVADEDVTGKYTKADGWGLRDTPWRIQGAVGCEPLHKIPGAVVPVNVSSCHWARP